MELVQNTHLTPIAGSHLQMTPVSGSNYTSTPINYSKTLSHCGTFSAVDTLCGGAASLFGKSSEYLDSPEYVNAKSLKNNMSTSAAIKNALSCSRSNCTRNSCTTSTTSRNCSKVSTKKSTSTNNTPRKNNSSISNNDSCLSSSVVHQSSHNIRSYESSFNISKHEGFSRNHMNQILHELSTNSIDTINSTNSLSGCQWRDFLDSGISLTSSPSNNNIFALTQQQIIGIPTPPQSFNNMSPTSTNLLSSSTLLNNIHGLPNNAPIYNMVC